MRKNIIIYGAQGSGKTRLAVMLIGKYHTSEVLYRTGGGKEIIPTQWTKVIIIENPDLAYVKHACSRDRDIDWNSDPKDHLLHIFTFQQRPDLPKETLSQCQVIETINC